MREFTVLTEIKHSRWFWSHFWWLWFHEYYSPPEQGIHLVVPYTLYLDSPELPLSRGVALQSWYLVTDEERMCCGRRVGSVLLLIQDCMTLVSTGDAGYEKMMFSFECLSSLWLKASARKGASGHIQGNDFALTLIAGHACWSFYHSYLTSVPIQHTPYVSSEMLLLLCDQSFVMVPKAFDTRRGRRVIVPLGRTEGAEADGSLDRPC